MVLSSEKVLLCEIKRWICRAVGAGEFVVKKPKAARRCGHVMSMKQMQILSKHLNSSLPQNLQILLQ